MTTPVAPRPVAVYELRRAWHAVQAGEFRAHWHPQNPSLRRPPRPVASESVSVWTPSVGEQVVPVVGCAGSCGATTVALALATAAGGLARLVECASVSATGLAAASTAELGVTEAGWVRGSRDQVLLERSDGSCPAGEAVPLPSQADRSLWTIIDPAQPIEQLLAGDGWLAHLLADTPVLVLAARATVPGLRRLETCLALVGAGRVVVAVLGPTRKRWPGQVIHSLGPLTRALITAGRLVEIPEDRVLAVAGLTPAPLPSSLITAAASLLFLTKGAPRDAV